MNDKLNNNVTIIPPFKRFCMTIGELPTSYTESMTYYESLVWLCNYIGNTLIPAINNNGEAVTELQEKYVELKNYVDNYFENLDVQTEINNKLDDMAEQGELAEIIAQYLEVASVLGYDTKSALKGAENIVSGSICKTLGDSSYDDGDGHFYKVRDLEEGDVIDDDELVELTNYPALVAEKIPDFYINELNEKVNISVRAFNTVAEMKLNTDLINGNFVETYGYYAAGDGGNAKYKIRTITIADTPDEMFLIELADENLVAELIIEDDILNVLKVGVKNDNSEDVSTKLNTVCQNYSVYLPAGQYKVDNTISLKYSMYGEGYARDGSNFNGKTLLNSSVLTNTITITGNSTQTSQVIENINIKMDSGITDTAVINYDPINDQSRCYINHVSVTNFCGTAININPTDAGISFISRGVYIDTICLIARAYQNSKGIYCSNKVGDNIFSNLEIMFTKFGIDNRSTINVSNAHIWTGGTGTDSNNWWTNTRGIFNANGSLQATNLYLDTCAIAIVNDGGYVMVDNFTYWEDNSISGSSDYASSICYGNTQKDYLNIVINNARIFIGERVKYINGKITNLKLLYNSLSNLELNSLRDVSDLTYSLTYTQSGSSDFYLPVAILQKVNNGYAELAITADSGQNSQLKISYDWTNTLDIKATYFNKNNYYYYKVDGNKYIIYIKTDLQTMKLYVTINAKSNGLFPLNLNDLINRQNSGEFIGNDYITTDGSTLTQITQTQVDQ